MVMKIMLLLMMIKIMMMTMMMMMLMMIMMVMIMIIVMIVMRMMLVAAHNMQSLWTQDMDGGGARNRVRFFVHVSRPSSPKNDRAR